MTGAAQAGVRLMLAKKVDEVYTAVDQLYRWKDFSVCYKWIQEVNCEVLGVRSTGSAPLSKKYSIDACRSASDGVRTIDILGVARESEAW